MALNVLIRGDGVAARCCAHLLKQAGARVSFEGVNRARVPAIMLSPSAQGLIRDIFGSDHLFRDLPQIKKRIVAWGPNAATAELEHSAVVVSEEFLLNSLGEISHEDIQADWIIYATPPLPESTSSHRFGSRAAAPMRVELKPGAHPAACWIESLEDGWLFLITTEPGNGWLLAVGSEPEGLLENSTLVQEEIASSESASVHFPASPRMISPLGESGWISCGAAAMGFDPLCGDGTAHAVREAILASAVIRAAIEGKDTRELLAHYDSRLTAGFQRHLAICRDFYMSGGSGAWWQAEAASTIEGLNWCGQRLANHGPFRYQLSGLDLKRV